VAGILFYAVATFGIGLMFGLDPLVAQAFGAGDVRDCHKSLLNALWMAVPLAPILMLICWGWGPVMTWVEVNPAVLREAKPYLAALNWSLPPLLVYSALRTILAGDEPGTARDVRHGVRESGQRVSSIGS
jgi:MATE family multidrug resistance protein